MAGRSEEGTGKSTEEVERQVAAENEPFARQTTFGGLVCCNSFENCANGKIEQGGECCDCCRNKYSRTKEKDNFAQKGAFHGKPVEETVGSFQSGDLSITFGSMFENCKILVNGKPVKDLIAFNIIGQQNSLIFYQLTFSGNPGPAK